MIHCCFLTAKMGMAGLGLAFLAAAATLAARSAISLSACLSSGTHDEGMRIPRERRR